MTTAKPATMTNSVLSRPVYAFHLFLRRRQHSLVLPNGPCRVPVSLLDGNWKRGNADERGITTECDRSPLRPLFLDSPLGCEPWD